MIRVEEETTSRLDTYLAEKLELSRSKIQKLIKVGSDGVEGITTFVYQTVQINSKLFA